MRRLVAYLLAALLAGGPALACSGGLDIPPDALAGADVVVAGRIAPSADAADVIEVEVVETLAGEARASWTLLVRHYPFPGATIGYGEVIAEGEAVLLGIHLPAEGVAPTPDPYDVAVTVPTLFAAPCAYGALYRDTAENRARIAAALEARP